MSPFPNPSFQVDLMSPSSLASPFAKSPFAWLFALLLAAASPAVQSETPPAAFPAESASPFNCLGEEVCALSAPAFSPRAREMALLVLEHVYALPDEEKRYFLEQRRDAVAFAIFPYVVRQGFMVANLYGKGILSYKDEAGGWSAPILLTIQGSSTGPLYGVQSSNIIFTFKTASGLKDFLSGHHHIIVSGRDIAVEHVGHEADSLGIRVHSFDRGMMFGQSLDQYSIHIDAEANAALYGLALTPCCLVEATRIGPRAPWMLKFFEKMQLQPGEASRTIDVK